jgi:hypothetical protein
VPESPALGPRALGRALLERQLLLRRAGLTPPQAIEHLGGMQSQAPNAPYVGLWTRLADFRAEQLTALMTGRAVVRAHLMRNTVHLVTARDFLAFRALYHPVLAKRFASSGFARNLAGVDLQALRGAGRDLLAASPRRAWPAARPCVAGPRPALAGLRHHPLRADGPGAAARALGHHRPGRVRRRRPGWASSRIPVPPPIG